MRKFLVVICLMLFVLPCFAEYKPIPKNLSAQYKADMERIIDKEYPKVIEEVDKLVNEAEELYNRILEYGYFSNDQMDVINLGLIYENCTPAADIDLYARLMEVTQKKYLKVKFEPFATDWTSPFEDFMKPYLKDNNVNTQKLDDIAIYISKKNRIIKQYVVKAEKLRPTTE